MGSGGGGGQDVKYTQSHEQEQMMKALMPMFQGLARYGEERYFGGEANLGAPSAQGMLTQQDPSTAMPTQAWWESLSPEVKTGLYAPYEEAGQGLMKQLGSRGQLGSARGGLSGATGAAMGELAGQAAKNVGLSAWQMTAPAAMAHYQAGQQEDLADYNTAMTAWNIPMQTRGMMGSGMPQGYVTQQPNTFGNMMGGAAMGGLGAYMGGMNPYIGAGMGAMGGYFGG